MGIRLWKLPEYNLKYVADLERETGLPEILCRVMAARGVTDAAELLRFVRGDGLDDPCLLAGMEDAVNRLRTAVEEGERICVYGDYDCDGITATALLVSYLQAVGADVIYYVPNREKEGYGLNIAAVELLLGQRVNLLVTVDNGVSAHEEIAHAVRLGMDVIVTDHHTPRETLPPQAVAVVNPHREDCPSRFKELAGVGVVFKLICAMEGEKGAEMLEHYSDLVALGTVADVVPLTGENRVIVRHGLERITETENPGIAALVAVSGLQGRALTSESVAFGLAPRVNAAGRIGIADDVIELLLTDDAVYAEEAAAALNRQNLQRKKIEEEILVEIQGMLEEKPEILNKRILIVAGTGWHHGVVGIVSAKLTERYEKPCIVFSIEGEEARGSGRSIEGFSLIEAITACSKRLTRYGGHTLAAGLTLPAASLGEFSEQLQTFAKERYPVMPLPELAADCSLAPGELTVEAISALKWLEPFGAGNETPLFHLSGLRLEGIFPTSDGKHIRIRFSGEDNSFYAVYFGVSGASFPYCVGDRVEMMARVSVQEYNEKLQLSIKIVDLRPAGVPQEQVLLGRERYACFLREEAQPAWVLGEMLPGREDIALVYKYLRRAGSYPYGADALYLRLMPAGMDYCKLLVALDVLVEMGFVQKSGQSYHVVQGAPKANLSDSEILAKLTRLQTETLVN